MDTPLLACCVYIPQVLAAFQCPIASVRFLKVAVGAEIDEHVDGGLCYEFGEARFHIPVHTHAALDFRLHGERLIMQEGECRCQTDFLWELGPAVATCFEPSVWHRCGTMLLGRLSADGVRLRPKRQFPTSSYKSLLALGMGQLSK